MIIETQKLILRPLTLAGAETAYYGWTGDLEVAKYVGRLPHHSIEYAIEWLRKIQINDLTQSIDKLHTKLMGAERPSDRSSVDAHYLVLRSY